MRDPLPCQALPASRQARTARMKRLNLERLEGRELLTAVAPPSGLISWWTGDSTAVDLKGANNASLYNGANYAAGKVGQAINFDGVNDRAQVVDADSLKLTGSLTIGA